MYLCAIHLHYRYKLKNKQGMTDDVSRGEVELTLRWRFNPDFVVSALQ